MLYVDHIRDILTDDEILNISRHAKSLFGYERDIIIISLSIYIYVYSFLPGIIYVSLSPTQSGIYEKNLISCVNNLEPNCSCTAD